ncbi:hypothetical protein [Tabrizicola oligotrophica]|uniref:Uncharacterized protein n=1 Tax=Tabrizicola oligotrophica TaxID=2710650 RepID=A0A6M0QPB2_9RHOB|nr:hypothetical protein [Tabrizicola oligotrophica]NEY89328.1 hypothetical protein [Tabrizicola oligotrophica]
MTRKPYDNPVRIVGQLRGKLADLDRDLTGLEGAFKGGVKGAFNGDAKAAHRAAHKRGGLPKVEADPEVKAFIIARLDRLTFSDIVAELKQAFPPDRHISRSSVHRWWLKTGRFLPLETAQSDGAQSTNISSNRVIP